LHVVVLALDFYPSTFKLAILDRCPFWSDYIARWRRIGWLINLHLLYILLVVGW
jgi:hypothetical protein